MKYLVVEMTDGTWWAIPVRIIAENMACYYATLDAKRGDGEYEDVYAQELAYALSYEEDYEILDWAANNMNWADVCSHAIELKVDPPQADYGKDWTNVPKTIREMEEMK